MFEQADLLRLIEGDCSPEEAGAIQAWVAADPGRSALLDQLRAVWRITGDATRRWDIPDSPDRSERGTPSLELVPPRRRWWTAPWATAIAAAAVAVLVVGSLRVFFPRPVDAPHAYTTARGQLSSLTLPDGSRVLLGADTRLRVPREYGTPSRTLDLEGEAYFVVAYDAKRPFIVRTEHASTQDLGTEFAVRAYRYEPAVEVVVAEGQVALRGLKGADPVLVTLRSRERAVLDSSGGTMVTRDVPLAQYLAWTRGALMFDDAPLARVAAQLERWYDLEIETHDAGLADERVTISFMTKSADEAVKALAQVLDVHATRTGRVVRFVPIHPRH
jgi:transmembrane sensor